MEPVEVIEGLDYLEESQNNFTCLFCCKAFLFIKDELQKAEPKFDIFCQAFNLTEDTFTDGLRMSPLCTSCMELIESIGAMLKCIQDMEVKLKFQKETVIKFLHQDYLIQFTDEVTLFPNFCPAQFRVNIQEKLKIVPNVSNTVSNANKDVSYLSPLDDDRDEFLDIPATPGDEDDDCQFAEDEIDTLEPSVDAEDPLRIVNSDEDQPEDLDSNIKYNLPEGQVIRECSVRLERLSKVKRKLKPKDSLSRTKVKVKAPTDPSKPIPCKHLNSKCTQYFPDEETMIEHVRRIHLITDLNCRLCGSQFETRKTFFKHQVTIHGEPYPFLCKEIDCGKGFMFAEDLKYHMFSHTGGPSIRKKRNRKRNSKDPRKLIPCKYKDQDTEEKKCGLFFTDEQSMMAHIRLVHTSEDCTCGICGVSFGKRMILLRHKIKVHGEPLPFFCEEANCGKGFMSASNLKSHMYSHTGEYPYRCEKCNSGFVCQSKLKEHLHVHLKKDDKNFICEVCGKTCKSLKLVTLHQRYHFEGRRFKCTLCSWAFKSNTSLKNHMKSIHGESDNRPHLCHDCGAGFKLKSQLDRHLRHHGERKLKFSHRKRKMKPAPQGSSIAPVSGECLVQE